MLAWHGLPIRWQAAGHLSTSVVVLGANAIGRRLVKVVREDYAESGSRRDRARICRRHRMRPGITGWAQLRGAVDEPALIEARVNHDICYIDNWSFFFDLRILGMTVVELMAVELIRPRNAF